MDNTAPKHHCANQHIDPVWNLGTTVNPYAYPLTAELTRHVSDLSGVFPERLSESLTNLIAHQEGITADNVLIGTGASSLVWRFLSTLSPREILFVGPVANDYYHICKQLQISFDSISTLPQDDFSLSPSILHRLWETSADLIVFSYPNSITGSAFPDLRTVFSMVRAPRVLIDGSLLPFLPPDAPYTEYPYRDCLQFIRPGVSLFFLHDLSSFFGCPGLCLAYLLGDKHPIEGMFRHSPEYAVTAFSQHIGTLLLQNRDNYRSTLPSLTDAITAAARTLRRSPLFGPDMVFEGPSFLCAGLNDASLLPHLLNHLSRHHMHVFDCSPIRHMPPGFVRLSPPPTDSLMSAFEQVLGIIADELIPS